MSDDLIFRQYGEFERNRKEQAEKSKKPIIFNSTTPPIENSTISPRWESPSFRSQPFNVGEGFQTLSNGQTLLLAKKSLPAGYSGVLTGFIQHFPEEDSQPGVVNSVTWALRINGLPVRDFNDFVGQFSLPHIPCAVNLPLIGSDTLGIISYSPGSSSALDQQVPTVALYATNNFGSSVILQARLIGYTFPLSERNDEFTSF